MELEMPLRGRFVQRRELSLKSDGLGAGRPDLNVGANSLTASRSHIIKASLDVLAECHF
jgi:hypothetical protein